MSRHSRFEKPYEPRIHKLILIGNIEADDPLVIQGAPKFLLKLIPVRSLHDNDKISPLNQFDRQRIFRVIVGSGGSNLDIGTRRKNLLRCRTS